MKMDRLFCVVLMGALSVVAAGDSSRCFVPAKEGTDMNLYCSPTVAVADSVDLIIPDDGDTKDTVSFATDSF